MRGGLLQPPQGAQEPMQGPMQGGMPESESDLDQASPKEQRQYNDLMGAFFGLIHGEKTRDSVVERLKAGREELGKTIGDMALQMFTTVESDIQQKGGDMTDSVRLEVGEDLIMELVQVAVAAKLMPDDEESLGMVVSGAIDVMASQYGNMERDRGRVDPQQAQESLAGLESEAEQMFAQNPMAQGVRQAGEMMG